MTQAVVLSQFANNNPTFRNRIINGAMVIDQRNSGASVTPSTGQYTVDRFNANLTQASKFTVQQNAGSVTPPAGFTNYLGVTVGASANVTVGAGDIFNITQNIEAYNFNDMAWGTASASTITLSFWVRSSLTGTFGGALKNATSARSYPFSYTISSANTWEQKTITITGDTSGTWAGTNGIGVQVIWSIGTGSTYSGTAGSWASANYLNATGSVNLIATNSATFYITGVQLEAGTTATPFEYRSYGTELALCQRYYWQAASVPIGLAVSATNTSCGMVTYPVTMRTSATLTNPTFAVNSGSAGTVSVIGYSANAAGFYNGSNNWTTNAIVGLNASVSAEL